MLQWIITILIVAAAFSYFIYRILIFFKRPKAKATDCEGCSSECEKCPLVTDLKNFTAKKN